jgi:hypothetical protein
VKPSSLEGVSSIDTPTIRLEGRTINAITTANGPALIAIMTIGQGMPFLSVSSALLTLDVLLEPSTLQELHAALGKLLEVAS